MTLAGKWQSYGGRGIGRAVALKLANCGAKVVLASRTAADLSGVVEEIKTDGGTLAKY